MKNIIINQQNINHFIHRYQKIHNVGFMEAQEQVSRILGVSDNQYNNFLIEFKNIVNRFSEEKDLYYFDFREADIKYVRHEIHKEKFKFDNMKYKTSFTLDSLKPDAINEKITDIKLNKLIQLYLAGKDSQKWRNGFIQFLKSLPKIIKTENVFLLNHYDFIDYSNQLRYLVDDTRYYEYSSMSDIYVLDYFSGEIEDHSYDYDDKGQEYIINIRYGSDFIKSFEDEWMTPSKEDMWDEDYWENMDETFILSGDDLTIIETYDDEQDHHES